MSPGHNVLCAQYVWMTCYLCGWPVSVEFIAGQFEETHWLPETALDVCWKCFRLRGTNACGASEVPWQCAIQIYLLLYLLYRSCHYPVTTMNSITVIYYKQQWDGKVLSTTDAISVPSHTVLKLVQLQLKQQTWLHISAMSHCTEISTAPTETTDLTSHQCHVTLYWSQYTQQQKQHFILCTQAQQLLCFVFI